MPAPLIPIAIGGAVTALKLVTSWISGNDQYNILEDAVVAKLNAWEAHLEAVKNAYLAGPATVEAKASAVAEFEAGIAWLSGPECARNGSLKTWWRRGAIEDRDRGGQYDWYARFLDPIVNDPRLQGLSGVGADIFGGAGAAVGVSWEWAALGFAALLGLVWWRRHK